MAKDRFISLFHLAQEDVLGRGNATGDRKHEFLGVFDRLTEQYNSLALAETSLILARIFWDFDFKLLPESLNWDDQNAFIVWDKPPLMVKLIRHSV